MSSSLATLIALLLYAAATIPLGLIAVRWGSARPAYIAFCAAIVVLAFLQTGVLQRGRLTSPEVPQLALTGPQGDQCGRIYDILSDAAVLLERPSSQRVVVRGARWDQLPEPIRQAVLSCVEESASQASGGGDIEIIKR